MLKKLEESWIFEIVYSLPNVVSTDEFFSVEVEWKWRIMEWVKKSDNNKDISKLKVSWHSS